MTTLTFDAIGFSRALQSGGFSRDQADTLAAQQQKALTELVNARDLATRGDLLELKMELEREMNANKLSLIKWIVGSILSLAAFLAAVIFGIFAVLPQMAGFIRS